MISSASLPSPARTGRLVQTSARSTPTDPGRDAGRITLEEKVRFLRRPGAYPERPSSVRAIETHMSWVFLTDRLAYKLKKPVHYDVLDFSTLWRRHRSCLREVRLNRRLAPEVYRGVVPLTLETEGALRLGGTGPPVEWLVEMNRLPADRMLDRLIASGGVARSDVAPVAAMLAYFYHDAIPAMIDEDGYREHLREGIRADRDVLVRSIYGLPVPAVRRIAESQLCYLAEASEVFDRRVREGRIVEGHGDLRPEHICLDDPPAIFDCLEFSRDLRMLDPADELSFLGLECLRLGAPNVGDWFLAAYRDVAGDSPDPELLSFYRRFRALRRAKIAIWHLREPDIGGADQWRERAAWYLEACPGL